MTTDIDLERVREAYPDPQEPSPERLASLRARLVEQIDSSDASQARPPSRRSPRRARRRERHLIPSAVALVTVVAGVALLIISSGSPGPGLPGVAEARAMLRGAVAGLAVPAGAVLHTADTGVQPFPNGRSTRWREQTWQETSRPYSERYIFSPAGRRSQQYAVTAGRLQLYDPQRNTIYTNESPPPYMVRPAARAGRYLLKPEGARTITITASQLRGLRDGQDTIVISNRPFVAPYSSLVNAPLDIRTTALSLLHSGHAHVDDHVKFAGRAALEISGRGRVPAIQNSYYVTPRTYQPLGLVQRFHGTTVTLRFTAYQLLPGTVANRALVTLAGARPSAGVDTSAADFNAAFNRLLG
jgi:hypothetical protein